ncbi:MAG: efflux RND transporter periplasmic adaptor subunit [Cytophagales bacterium]|nr:efflux RND transporter periplasmic adaptor subunit [Bernardetiaceae bacterium]MDW8203530.1 efflux RND transporter periplasmic adaptor subunit [Cytophagales bacterium]
MNRSISHIVCSLVFVVAASCSGKQEPATNDLQIRQVDFVELTPEQLKTMEIQLAPPSRQPIVSNIYLNGKVISLPNLSATVSSNIEGKIEKVFVSKGSLVRKGQPLMVLSSMQLIELQNEYLAAKSEVDFYAVEYKRQEELIKNNVGALADFQITEAKYNAALSREKALRAKLQLLGVDAEQFKNPKTSVITPTVTIKAPIDGYITELPVNIGMLASVQTKLAEIIDNQQLYAEIFVYEKDLDLITEGQEVEIDFINSTFDNVMGKVISISRAIDPETRAIKAFVQFAARKGDLILPGMNVRAVVLNKEGNQRAITVPLSSLMKEDDQTYVFAGENRPNSQGKLKIVKYKVEVGNTNDTLAEIIFPNGTPPNILVAKTNVMVLETQRRQMSGMNVGGE